MKIDASERNNKINGFYSLAIADDQTRTGRVVGGSSAAVGQFPFMASIRNGGQHACGGALVSARWVISAAHCTRFLAPGQTTILLGTISRTSGGSTYAVSRIVNHFDFDPSDMEDDMSMVETGSPVVFSATVQPAALASGFLGSGVTLTLVGFGQTSNPGTLAATLQWMTATTMTNLNCRAQFNAINANRVQGDHICTSSPIGQG